MSELEQYAGCDALIGFDGYWIDCDNINIRPSSLTLLTFERMLNKIKSTQNSHQL